jgi:hypothetical protein
MPISYTALPDSTYLDFTSYRSGADPLSGGTPVTHFSVNVALVLDRANDPTALLSSDWGSRQQQLAALNQSGTLWSTYGADPAKYHAVLDALHADGIQTVNEIGANGYVSSVESRTIWVHLDETNFTTLFGPGATLLSGTTPTGQATWYWNGNLSLPDAMAAAGVSGLWFDSERFDSVLPNPGGGVQAAMPQGPQSLGNSAGSAATNIFPQQIADDYYNFPLSGALWDPASGSAVATKAIGLVEPGVGTALPTGSASFQALIDHYRASAGISTSAKVITVDGGGQAYPDNIVPPAFNPAGERSLDVGVVTAINPHSPLIVYAGSGTAQDAEFNTFTAYQSAFWDTTNNPEVITSSFGFTPQVAPGSPFSFAARELFIDAALRNITVFSDNGDGGSGDQYGNGLTNVQTSRASPFGVMVGGTALSTMSAAMADGTLSDVVVLALTHDPATVWQLVAGGLTSLPSTADGAATLVETVWNQYFLNGTSIAQGASGTGFIHNNTSSGGVDPSQPVPSYQHDFGLTPTTSDPDALTGRGTPDVSADAGGNMHYRVPGPTMEGLQNDSGTSASTPLWAALTSQFNAIFHDEGLPTLGYMNDLLYIAAAIAPGSFNDITMGNNTSSFTFGGAFTSDGHAVTPTGFGYYAGPGYDLVTGLGTPNGVLLGRALTAIAHSEMSSDSSADVINPDGHGGWTSGADQSLLFQTMSDAVTAVGLHTGPDAFGFFSTASDSFAWTSRMAEQSLQPDFDPALVIMFDKQAQGGLMQEHLSSGEALAVSINASPAQAIQAGLSSPFGFADFLSGDAAVRVARPVAVAETADGGNDDIAIVRLRQDGQDNLALTFYRVDDLSGTINGLHPGDGGYHAALESRAYQLSSGSTSLAGPGYGNYAQADLMHVNAGDLITMQLTNNTHGDTYLGFAQANEMVNGQHVGHLWNYGLNTWGWEDTRGGGDHDYNDLIVQLDFTSTAGHGWLT